MTSHCSVLNLMLNVKSLNQGENQILTALDRVTAGRYLITVYENQIQWEPSCPWDSKVISLTMGPIENRSENWEFFGNGAIRCYNSKELNLERTLSWIIVKKAGPKPYARKKDLSSDFLIKNELPVSDKVFTRDVANNVWHVKNETVIETMTRRFSRLLCWNDEDFLLVDVDKTNKVIRKSKLNLNEDLVGVPTKYIYDWNISDKLF